MKKILEDLSNHLKTLKQDGVDTLYLSPNTLQSLEKACQPLSQSLSSQTPQKLTLIPSEASSPPTSSPKKEPFTQILPGLIENTPADSDQGIPSPIPFDLPPGSKQEQWDWLRQKVLTCPVCVSHVKPGKKVVFGVGDLNAKIFFCGEAPGADEEKVGEPFVGKAGQLLTKIIQAMGLQRKDVYIGNIMNWRPELPSSIGNRPPTPKEMAFCLPYLKAQVQIIKPQVIVALGNTAVSGLLGPDPKRRMTDIRGKWTEFENTPLMVTFHPSYLLRNNTSHAKRQVWEDMLLVMGKIGLPISEKQRNFFQE